MISGLHVHYRHQEASAVHRWMEDQMNVLILIGLSLVVAVMMTVVFILVVSFDDDEDHGRSIRLTVTPHSLVGMFDGRRPENPETGRDDGLRRE